MIIPSSKSPSPFNDLHKDYEQSKGFTLFSPRSNVGNTNNNNNKIHSTLLFMNKNEKDDNFNKELAISQEEGRIEVLKSRRKQIRSTLRSAEALRNYRLENGYEETEEEKDGGKSALTITAFVVAMGAILLRVGGRTALVSTLGLDFAQDNPELQVQLDSFIQYTSDLGFGLEFSIFVLAWTFVKVFCFDAGAIILAFSSGILFGGVIQGAVLSAFAATFGSFVAFSLAKIDSPFRKKALEIVEEYPSLRGIEKVVAKDGIKAILTLRLAPVLPIPIGLYNYVYAITNVPIFDFVAGIFLGSLKPYLLDSYLGYFGKELVEGAGSSDTEDAILLVVLGFSVLIGVFASQLASETWEAVQKEVELEKEALENSGEKKEEKDGIVRSIAGIDLPEIFVGAQINWKEASERIEEFIEIEYEAKVWNYTHDGITIPPHKDPAKFLDAPEITGKNKGFDFVKSLFDGMVLSPALFSAFLKYSDPAFVEVEGRNKAVELKTSSSVSPLGKSESSEGASPLDKDDGSYAFRSGVSGQITTEKMDVADLSSYLLETLEDVKSSLEERIVDIDAKLLEASTPSDLNNNGDTNK
eukprot:CAMPEP_0178954804 /NCGR_PEP_ID=MMETSP0789-20121207/9216_1 /TAXON_ID=3005 /ORGANISM="Rhizosolenia setigera, Strain CCMP 1694" /LENGTH=583 /DNA_ID=CAMNT_0020636291 /DNA_START=333 /DNA_END=2087 /DNA_ORIENTATION=+